MKALVVFAMRVVVFFCAIFSKIYFRQTYVVDYSIRSHILLSSVQMCLVFAGIGVYRACVFVVSTVNEGVQYESVQEEVGADVAEVSGEMPAADIFTASSTIRVVVFQDTVAVRRHVMKIHSTAVLLWGTYYSFDVSTFDTFYFFVLGLFVGWASVTVLWIYAHGFKNMKMGVVYLLLCNAVLVMNFQDSLIRSAGEVVMIGLFPLACGAAWMLLVDTDTVCDDVQSVSVTALLVCSLIIATNSWLEILALLASSRVVFVYLLLLEPAIKGLALCVLVLSMHTKYRTETMLMYTCILGMACMYLREERDGAGFFGTLAMTSVLLVSQIAGVIRREIDGPWPARPVV